jgi:hemin uptake protein HemP
MTIQAKPVTPNPLPPKIEIRPSVNSAQILGGASAVEIEHAGQRYLLRVTRENKLILTK